jgi:hypothetical protein
VASATLFAPYAFHPSHQRLAGIPRAGADRRRENQERAPEQRPAGGTQKRERCRSLNAAQRFRFFACMVDRLFLSRRGQTRRGRERLRVRGRETRWHGLLFFV